MWPVASNTLKTCDVADSGFVGLSFLVQNQFFHVLHRQGPQRLFPTLRDIAMVPAGIYSSILFFPLLLLSLPLTWISTRLDDFLLLFGDCFLRTTKYLHFLYFSALPIPWFSIQYNVFHKTHSVSPVFLFTHA